VRSLQGVMLEHAAVMNYVQWFVRCSAAGGRASPSVPRLCGAAGVDGGGDGEKPQLSAAASCGGAGDAADRVLCMSGLAFDASIIDTWPALTAGATLLPLTRKCVNEPREERELDKGRERERESGLLWHGGKADISGGRSY
jgi:hypothetical protein